MRSVVAPLLALMRPLNERLTYSDVTIEHLAVQDPRVLRLRSVPSIGPVPAAAFLAAIDDAQRFHDALRSRTTSAWCPASAARARRSGAAQSPRSATRARRWLLIQAAVSILRRRPPQADELRTWATRITARRGKQVAAVALALRLAGIL